METECCYIELNQQNDRGFAQNRPGLEVHNAKRAAQEGAHRFLSFAESTANQRLQAHYIFETAPLQ